MKGNILGNTHPFLTIGGPNHFSRRFSAVIEALNLDSIADAHATADFCWEKQGYRTLINSELRRQERPITFLVKPLGRSRSYVSRVLSGQNKLTQELRERAFTALGMDPIMVNIATAWLRDV